jgi:hypothetical protein
MFFSNFGHILQFFQQNIREIFRIFFFPGVNSTKFSDFLENLAKMLMWQNGKNKPLVPRDSHQIIFKNKLVFDFLDFCCSQCVLQIFS